MTTNVGKFEWKLLKHEIQSMIDNSEELKQNNEQLQYIKNGRFRSNDFTVNDTNFYLSCYANGYSSNNKGWVNLFLNLNQLPNNVNGIYARISLHCNEMSTHFVTVQNLSMIFTNIGWTDHSLKSNDIQLYLNDKSKKDYITFEVKIEILKCYYASNHIHMGNITYCRQFKMYPYITYKWHIYGYQLQSFQTATNGNRFCSETFGNDQFYLEVYPNGSNKTEISNVICNIRSLQFPFNVSKIECNISLKCNLNHINFMTNYEFLNTPHSGIGWNVGMINTNQLYDMKANDIITFSVDIHVLKIYDINNNIINKQLWSDYIIDKVDHGKLCVEQKFDHDFDKNTNKILMELVNNLQKEMVCIKQKTIENEQKYIQEMQQQNKKHKLYEIEIHSMKQELLQYKTVMDTLDMEHKNNDEYDLIIDLRRDLESLKKEFRNVQKLKRRNSELNGLNIDRNGVLDRHKNKKRDRFKEWLRADEISIFYYDLFMNEGIESLDMACKLTEQQLIEIGIIKYGHIQLLCDRFKQYREGVQVIEDDHCEGAGYIENIALPDFNADIMPNAVDDNMDNMNMNMNVNVNVMDNNGNYRNEHENIEEKKENENNIMAFAQLSDIILPVINNDNYNDEFAEENEIDGQSKSSKSNNDISKSEQSISLDFVD